jgi:hypothetical protein
MLRKVATVVTNARKMGKFAWGMGVHRFASVNTDFPLFYL